LRFAYLYLAKYADGRKEFEICAALPADKGKYVLDLTLNLS